MTQQINTTVKSDITTTESRKPLSPTVTYKATGISSKKSAYFRVEIYESELLEYRKESQNQIRSQIMAKYPLVRRAE